MRRTQDPRCYASVYGPQVPFTLVTRRMWDPSQFDATRATLYLILMKKTTTPKNPRKPQKQFKCPQCGKSFQNAQGLSGHLRYLHPKPQRPAIIPQPAAKQKTKVGASALVP